MAQCLANPRQFGRSYVRRRLAVAYREALPVDGITICQDVPALGRSMRYVYPTVHPVQQRSANTRLRNNYDHTQAAVGEGERAWQILFVNGSNTCGRGPLSGTCRPNWRNAKTGAVRVSAVKASG